MTKDLPASINKATVGHDFLDPWSDHECIESLCVGYFGTSKYYYYVETPPKKAVSLKCMTTMYEYVCCYGTVIYSS